VQLRDWLSSKSITHVVMESTGSYWVPFFNILEGHFIIVLANPERDLCRGENQHSSPTA
jgi:hypothetical protein